MLSLPEIWPLRAAAVRLVLAASGDVPSPALPGDRALPRKTQKRARRGHADALPVNDPGGLRLDAAANALPVAASSAEPAQHEGLHACTSSFQRIR
jgi:hypothetical protein